ncbi:hypothetical protein, partial [uncultured Ruminococcus sp.]|uniref:hypothetical protein n=1 Tax=uncultured Ruminococcus sp. TaxID=165186 RepID=UPI0025888392
MSVQKQFTGTRQKNPLRNDPAADFFVFSFVFMAIPHKDCTTDASSNFSSDETKSGVNTCCIHEHF